MSQWTTEWTLQDVVNCRDGDQYTLLVYMSDAHGNIPRYCFNITPSQPVSMYMDLQIKKGFAAYLHCWLFLTSSSDDPDQAVSQALCAFGHIPTRKAFDHRNTKSKYIDLVDINEHSQGRLELKNQHRPTSQTINSTYIIDRPLLLEFNPSWITRFQSQYYQPNIEYLPRKQAYTHLKTPFGDLPLLCFPMMMTMVSESYWKQSNNDQIWIYFLHIAIYRLGYDYTYLIHHLEKEDDGADDDGEHTRMLLRILGEMLSLISHGHLFVDDRERISSTETILIDSWTNLGIYPNPGYIGCDCEDASGFVYQQIHILRHIQTKPNSLLSHIQLLLNQYTAFICLGTQYVGPGDDDYFPHAFVILHESIYVDHLLNSNTHHEESLLPSLLLDTVNYIEPLFYEDEWTTSEYRSRLRISKQEESFIDEHPEMRRFLKPYILAGRLAENEQYGDISHMLTSHHRGQAMHWIVKQPSLSKDFKIGYGMENMMLKKATSKNIEMALTLNTDDCISLHTCLNEFPWATFLNPIPNKHMKEQLAAAQMNYQNKKHTHPTYLIRSRDYRQRKKEIQTLLSSPTAFHITLAPELEFTELTMSS